MTAYHEMKSIKITWSRTVFVTILFCCLATVIWALHPGLSEAGWRFDDPQMLEFAINHSMVDSFYKPDTWKELGAPFFTPLLTLSYWVDYRIFGMNPWGFYVHQIAALALALTLSYKVLEKDIHATFAGKIAAALGLLLFLSGTPVFVVTEQIMTRHYIEGLCLAILSFLLYKKHTPTTLILSALCYLLAILAKEIYIPLPIIIFYSHWSKNRAIGKSLKIISWHISALALYAGWRTYMLQGVGGYSEKLLPSTAYLLNFLEAGKNILFTEGALGWILFCACLICIAVFHGRRPQKNFFTASIAALAIIPLFPAIASIPSPMGSQYFIYHRYLFLPWWLLCMALVHASATSPPGRPAQHSSLILLAVAAVVLAALNFHDNTKRSCFGKWAFASADVYLANWHERPLRTPPPPAEVTPYLTFMQGKISLIKQSTSERPPDTHLRRGYLFGENRLPYGADTADNNRPLFDEFCVLN
jgi:hypothetical protein